MPEKRKPASKVVERSVVSEPARLPDDDRLWVEVDGVRLWWPKKKDVLEGTFVRLERAYLITCEVNVYVIEDSAGVRWGFFGTEADMLFAFAEVVSGDVVRVVAPTRFAGTPGSSESRDPYRLFVAPGPSLRPRKKPSTQRRVILDPCTGKASGLK